MGAPMNLVEQSSLMREATLALYNVAMIYNHSAILGCGDEVINKALNSGSAA
jgi:hypothetical protein